MTDTTAKQKLEDGITKRFVELICDGVPATSESGEVVVDSNGNVVRVPPSAAMLQAAIKWFDRLGGDGGDDPNEQLARMIAEAQRDRGGEIPPLDDQDDDEATR